MKNFRHFALDKSDAIQLPGFCRWVRVFDFEPWGFNPNGANVIGKLEEPTLRIDNADPIRVNSYMHYAKDKGYYGSVELTGNIEVQVGEQGDFPPGPITQPKLEIPLSWVGYPSGSQQLIPLPKLIQKASIMFLANGAAPLINFIRVWPAFIIAGTIQGTNTAWRNGNSWNLKDNLILPAGGLGAPLCPLFSYDGPPAAAAVLLQLMPHVPPSNDAPNQAYVRPWSPVPALYFQITSSDASPILLQAHFTTS